MSRNDVTALSKIKKQKERRIGKAALKKNPNRTKEGNIYFGGNKIYFNGPVYMLSNAKK